MTHPTVTTTRTDLFAGRYRVEGALGHGGGADVLRAVDERLQRTVALKVLRPGSAADADRFVTEALSLARLRHPGLVEVYDADATGAHPYLVLELVDGPTLAALLSAGPLGPAATVRTGRQLARTLAFVHQHRIVHRDVKPSNVLIDRDGNPRLADFGIARALDDAGHTRTGAIVGTPAYLAPEQVRGQGAGPAADVYALGLLLIECLTGRREYTGGPVEAAVARLLRPPAVPSGLPPHLARALAAMTAAVVLRLRFDDFGRATRSRTMPRGTASTDAILDTARGLVAAAAPLIAERGLTLVGFEVSNIDRFGAQQLELPFEEHADTTAIDQAVDMVRRRYGNASLTRGVLLGRDPGLEMPHLPD